MATFQRDASGNWALVNYSAQKSVLPFALGAIALLALSSIILVRPAGAATTAKKQVAAPVVTQPVKETSQKFLVSPTYGKVKLGAFAGEAANIAGLTYISTTGLANKNDYAKYRSSILSTYGVDLEDMNYFSLAPEKLDYRLEKLKTWLLMAGEYGDVTLAIEPLGKETYDVFEDNRVMSKLNAIFLAADKKGITVWVRFASESNLRGSEYSAVNHPQEFYQAAAHFKSQMPKNVKLVFSPLINTYIIGGETQTNLAKQMLYGPNTKNKIWDRIGGTIYRTDRPLKQMFDTYYRDMHEIAPLLQVQICEVGGPYSRREELLEFLESCSRGTYPQLVKVNLFARNINKRADPDAEFGYLDPNERLQKAQKAKTTGKPQQLDSFLKPILQSSR